MDILILLGVILAGGYDYDIYDNVDSYKYDVKNHIADKRKVKISDPFYSDKLKGKIAVMIESEPESADIKVDGIYIGSTPLLTLLDVRFYNIELSKTGFENWMNPVKVYKGLKIKATLSKKNK